MNIHEKNIRTLGLYRSIADPLIDYVFADGKFVLWSGSSKVGQHHYGTGGLVQHTWEVLDYANNNAQTAIMNGQKINETVLFLSCLYHDVGKIWDYVPYFRTDLMGKPDVIQEEFINKNTSWMGCEHKRRIHHVSRSAIEWTRAVAKTGCGKDIEDDVLHCILSHHGLPEWGSPVAPNTREAFILHHADSLSARLNDCGTADLVGRKL